MSPEEREQYFRTKISDAFANGKLVTFSLPDSADIRLSIEKHSVEQGMGYWREMSDEQRRHAFWSVQKALKRGTARVEKRTATQQESDNLAADAALWPTPTRVTDSGGAALCKWGGAGSRAKLSQMVTPEELNGALNPTWVEWLMGFPLGWTALGASETPSFPRSPSSSAKRFSKRKTEPLP